MSDTTEETKVPDVFFNGKDGKECEAFVAAIQAFAFSKRWDEDYQWILRFAKSCLRGKALRWYAKLDPTIKKDWDLFVQALFDEYPAVEDPDDGGKATPVWSATTFSSSPSTITLSANPELDPNATKPSLLFGPVMPNTQMGHEPCHFPHSCNQHTYPVRKYDASSAKQQIGLLRIVNEDEIGIPQYIWWDSPVEENIRSREDGYPFSFWKTMTLNRHEALIVSFLPSSVPHQIGCLNSRRALRNLAVRWHHGPDAELFTLHGCTSNRSFSSQTACNYGDVSKVWNFLTDGTLQVSLSSFSQNNRGQYDETKFTTTEVHVDISGETIRFVKPGALLEQDKPQGNPVNPFVRARIVFEPL